MNKMLFLGVDPGKSGAIGWIVADVISQEILAYGCEDLEVIKVSPTSKNSETDPVAMRKSIRQVLSENALTTFQTHVTLEHVWARPPDQTGRSTSTQAGASITNSMTCCKTVVKMMNLPFDLIVPAKWKKYFGLPADKEICRRYAQERFPAAASLLKFKKNSDRAEAMLMALYGLENYDIEHL